MVSKKIIKYFSIILAGLIGLFVLLIGIVSAIMYHNEEKIYEYVLQEINENQNGHTEVGHIDISPIKNFPYVSIGLHDLVFYADKTKNEEPIYQLGHVYAGFDLFSILKGNYTIKKIKLEDGFLRLVMNENGELNLLQAKADGKVKTDSTSSAPLKLDLKSMQIKNVTIEETNLQSDKFIAVHINKIKTNFRSSDDYAFINLNSDMVLKEYRSGKTTYFKDKAFQLKTALQYFYETEKLNISEGNIIVAQGSLDLTGAVDFKNELDLNLEISGRKKNFDLFISFAPEEVYQSLSRFKNQGDIFFKGKIFGPALYSSPAVDIQLGCENTFFFHKDNSKALKDLSFNGRFHTGKDNSLETSEFILNNLYGIPESGMFKGTFKVVNFVNPIISFDFHADLDLANFKAFYDPDWFEAGGGKVKIDIHIDEFIGQDSLVHIASQLEDGTMSRISFDNAWIKTNKYVNKIENLNGQIVFNGDNLDIRKVSAKIANSDILISAALKNINCLLHKQDAPLELTVHAESKKIDVAKLLPVNMSNDDSTWKNEVIHDLVVDLDFYSQVNALDDFKLLPKLTMDIRNFKARLEGFEQTIHQISGKIYADDKQLKLENFIAHVGENDLKAALLIENPYRFKVKSDGRVYYTVDLQSDWLDFKKLLTYRGKPLLDPELEAALGRELVQQLRFKGNGHLYPSTFSALGFRSDCKIDEFSVKLNNLPKIANTRGRLRTDSSGCLYIDEFAFTLGKSDFKANLALNHLFDNQKNRRYIKGFVGGKLWDLNDLMTVSQAGESAEKTTLDSASQHEAVFNIFALPFPVADFHFSIDQFIHQRYKLEKLKGHIRANREHQVFIDTLHFLAADGALGIKGYLNGKDSNDLYMAGLINIKNMDLDKMMLKMDNFGQEYVVNDQLHGRIDALIDAKVSLYPDLMPKINRTDAKITMNIRDGRLENFAPMLAMAAFMGDRNLNNVRFAELENTLYYKNGVLNIPRMKISSTVGYFYITGQQHLDQSMNYELQLPLSLVRNAGWNLMRNKLLGSKRKPKQNELDELEEEIISSQGGLIKRYITFNITGTSEDMDVSLGKNKNAMGE